MQPSLTLNEFLTVSEAAKRLGVCAATLRAWDRSGKLVPARHPINGYRLYRQQDLETLLEQLNNNSNDNLWAAK